MYNQTFSLIINEMGCTATKIEKHTTPTITDNVNGSEVESASDINIPKTALTDDEHMFDVNDTRIQVTVLCIMVLIFQ